MSYYFKTAEHEIYPASGKVSFKDDAVKIRPKTMQLLLMLIEGNGEIVSKSHLLAHVWDDVQVDDQVIFQSIKELRKIFSENDVIRTVPRKGYIWISPVEKLLIESPNTYEDNKKRPYAFALISCIFILLIMLALYLFSINTSTMPSSDITTKITNTAKKVETENTGSIIVLPFGVDPNTTNLQWLRYGGMDQLIHQLDSSDTYSLMQTEDVLDIMKRGDVKLNARQRVDIDRVFQVSGARLVIDVKLAGQPGDYQLIYSFHTRNNIKRGVVIQGNIEKAIEQLSNIIFIEYGVLTQQSTVAYHSDFAHQMLVLALEKIQNDNLPSAINYLLATIDTDKSNLIAHRLLGQLYLQVNDDNAAKSIMTVAFALAKAQKNVMEQGRITFWQALREMKSHNFDDALDLLRTATVNSRAAKDWLYLGHIEEITGRAYHLKSNFILAEQHYRTSIDYHQIIQCPNGHAQGLLNLAELHITQKNREKAQALYEKSVEIINSRNLHMLLSRANAIKQSM